MSEYIVKIGFWLRAYDGFTVEAGIRRRCDRARPRQPRRRRWSRAPIPNTSTSRSGAKASSPLSTASRPPGRHAVIEAVEFDDDRIHDVPPA